MANIINSHTNIHKFSLDKNPEDHLNELIENSNYSSFIDQNHAIVIDGITLSFILEK